MAWIDKEDDDEADSVPVHVVTNASKKSVPEISTTTKRTVGWDASMMGVSDHSFTYCYPASSYVLFLLSTLFLILASSD